MASLARLGGLSRRATRRSALWLVSPTVEALRGGCVRGDDYLVFGRETAGLPPALLAENRERWLRLPMFNPRRGR